MSRRDTSVSIRQMFDPPIHVRPATPADAEAVARLEREFMDYMHGLGDTAVSHFSAEAYVRDGFGASPAFYGLVAEVEGEVVGYMLYNFGYDTDLAARILCIIDLYVQEDCRHRGVGTALMRGAAAVCRQAGGEALSWSVHKKNRLAAGFYEKLGARYQQHYDFMYWPVS